MVSSQSLIMKASLAILLWKGLWKYFYTDTGYKIDDRDTSALKQ